MNIAKQQLPVLAMFDGDGTLDVPDSWLDVGVHTQIRAIDDWIRRLVALRMHSYASIDTRIVDENDQPTTGVQLSLRTRRTLVANGFRSLKAVAEYGEKNLRRIDGIGANALRELREALLSVGLDYEDSLPTTLSKVILTVPKV